MPEQATAAGRRAAMASVPDIADDIANGHHMEPGWLPRALQSVADDVLEVAAPLIRAAERVRAGLCASCAARYVRDSGTVEHEDACSWFAGVRRHKCQAGATGFCDHPAHVASQDREVTSEGVRTMSDKDEPCSRRCGYFSSGQDLIDHELHEHIPCPGCGAGKDDGQDLATYGLSHKQGCPRLQPGYTYPPPAMH